MSEIVLQFILEKSNATFLFWAIKEFALIKKIVGFGVSEHMSFLLTFSNGNVKW